MNKPGFGLDDIVGLFDSIQPGLFGNLLDGVLVPEFNELVTPVERNHCAIGMIRLLTQSNAMMSDQYFRIWFDCLT